MTSSLVLSLLHPAVSVARASRAVQAAVRVFMLPLGDSCAEGASCAVSSPLVGGVSVL